MSIRVTPKHVRVSIPYRVSFSEGENFLFKNIDWVRTKYNELKFNFKFYDHQIIPTLFGNIYISIKSDMKNKCKCITEDKNLFFFFNLDINSQDSQSYIREQILKRIRSHAFAYLKQRCEYLANKNGLNFSGVRLSSAMGRWGSCSHLNSISLNYRLVFLPQELCDYVILHELAHTIHKNHGPSFWAFMKHLSPNYEGLRKRLKTYKFTEML